MRIMALDPGRVRIGIAISDPSGTIASPLSFVNNNERLPKELEKLFRDYEPSLVLVGNPINMDGTKNAGNTLAEELKALVESVAGAPETILWDERMTTAESEELLISAGVSRKKRKLLNDKIAASLILRDYLNRNSGGKKQ